jgi:hypothetical protein
MFPSFPTANFSTLTFDTPRRDQAAFGAPFTNDFDDLPTSPFEPFHFTTSHLKAANRHFDNANEQADLVLAANHRHADTRTEARLLGNMAGMANLPHGLLPSLHKRVPATDKVRKAIGNSSAKKRGGAEGEENTETQDKNGASCANFNMGPALIKLVGAAVDVEPFLALHRGKGAAWQSVVDKLMEEKEFRNTTISAVTAQHKVESLVAFKKVRLFSCRAL